MTEGAEEDESTSLWPLLAHALRHWRVYLLGFATLAVVDYISVFQLVPMMGKPFHDIDPAHPPGADVYVSLALKYVAISLLQMVLRYFWRYFFIGGAERIAFEVRRSFFEKIQRLPIAFFDRAKTGDL